MGASILAQASPATQPTGGGAGGFVPGSTAGPIPRAIDWLHRNLFSSIGNTVLTLIVLTFFALTVPPFVEWAITGATISGASKAAFVTLAGPPDLLARFTRRSSPLRQGQGEETR